MEKIFQGARILLVHAHPDDETINNGATMAMYAAKGAQVTLITCTRGEEGEVLVPELAHIAAAHRDELGAHREIELADAMKALGITDYRYLGAPEISFRDSGMMGTPPNDRPDVFWQADVQKASQYLVEVIEEIKPHVLITYDEIGGYGHPDHIQAHRIAMAAASRATWKIPKIYWNTMPKSVIADGIEKMKALGSDFFGAESADDLPFAKDDASVTTLID
jgi:N-acetyl-1-D-myo-inositol-2-amino-2-deoxy-alpha-D-glucopyranoside deacetylase